MTNRQWLESLSDEWLANAINVLENSCGMCTYKDKYKCVDEDCNLHIMEWLQAEHEDCL